MDCKWSKPRTRFAIIIVIALIAIGGIYYFPGWWRAREHRIFNEEVLKPIWVPHRNEQGWWVGDIAENYRLGKISRKLAEADTAPLNPLVPKPIPIHGYHVRVMNSGPSRDGSLISYKGMKRCPESFAIMIYPADPALGKRTYLFGGGTYIRFGTWEPTFDYPTDEEIHKHWAIID